MAIVHLAEDHKFHTEVAVKMLKKEFVSNENIKKRFLAEARSMFRMSHPHVIRVSDLIDEGDTVAFVMEYVEGETLKEYLDRKGALPDNEVREIFSQMLDAVGYVHKQQLVHRDIKPSNFMIDKKGKVKLMDFGIAKTLDSTAAEYTQTGTGMQMGTPMYMSPEQITETKSVTAQSDIYSLGVVLWQMVTGKKPYDTKTLSNFQLQLKIVQEPLELTNTQWDGPIQMATVKDTSKRLQNSLDFSENLISLKKKKNTENKLTAHSSKEEKTLIEQIVSVEKVPLSSEKKSISTNPEELKREEEKIESTKTSKKWYFLLAIIPLLVLAIFLSLGDGDDFSSVETVTIGTQEWMTSNLSVATFKNGDPIPEAKTDEEWRMAAEEGRPAWSYFKNDPAYGEKYGKLYNWYAVNDPRGLAPEGWVIPSSDDWNLLIDWCYDNYKTATDTIVNKTWRDSIPGYGPEVVGPVLDRTRFNIFFGGYRKLNGEFEDNILIGAWWCSDQSDELGYENTAWYFEVDDFFDLSIFSENKAFGMSVRCLRKK
ncbi:MAG: protein kinase [Algoriphagus sp.]|nr:protein kinase [Algoriphagus sp.]